MYDQNDQRLTAYCLGELDEAQRQEIEKALADSPQLRQTMAEIRNTMNAVKAFLQSEPDMGLDQPRRSVIDDAAKATLRPQPEDTYYRRRRLVVTIVASAALLVGIAAFIALEPFASRWRDTLAKAIVSERAAEVGDAPKYGDLSRPSTEENAAAIIGDSESTTPSQHSNDPDEDPMALMRKEFGGAQPTPALTPSPNQRQHNRSSGGRSGQQMGGGMAEGKTSGGMAGMMGGAMGGRGGDMAGGAGGMMGGMMGGMGGMGGPSTPAENSAGGVNVSIADGSVPNVQETVDKNVWWSQGAKNGGAKFEMPKDDRSDSKAGEDNDKQKDASKPEDSRTASRRTWRRAKATPNASRLIVGDRDELPLEGMQVNVVIDGFRARVVLDCYYFNNRSRRLEGNFKLRLPNEASLYYFAFGESAYEYRPQVDQLASKGFLTADLARAAGTGPKEILHARRDSWSNVKEARIVPKEKAAHAYSETVRRRVDPALVEWAGAGVFNARVFPLAPLKLHRIVIGYDVNLRQDGDDLLYQVDLPEGVKQSMVDLNVAATPGASVEVNPGERPFTSGGRAYYHFQDPNLPAIHVRIQNPGAVVLHGADGQTGDYFAARMTPDLPAGEKSSGSPQAVFLLDTSLSSHPDRFNVWLQMMEAVLEENRQSLNEFAVLCFNIEAHWWKEGFVENTPQNVRQLMNFCHTLALEGATDLRQALAEAVSPRWRKTEKTNQGRPDLFLLSDGAITWGETNLHLVGKSLRAYGGALFAYRTGMSGTDLSVLDWLTRESGGAVFSVIGEDQVKHAAVAHRRRPWRLVEATVTGGDDLLFAGRLRSFYPGQPLLLVGRGKPTGQITLRLRRGDQTRTIDVQCDEVIPSDLAPRLYGQVAVGQLEDLRDAAYKVSVSYARHFRVAGHTCSLLMLDSQADYDRFKIGSKDEWFLVKSTPAAVFIETKLDEYAARLQDPKASMLTWLKRLEGMPGVNFRLSTGLETALERMSSEAFDVSSPPISLRQRTRKGLSKKYFRGLESPRLDYDIIIEEAQSRRGQYGAADALKVLSSLIERNPGNVVLTRDVAFSAIELGYPGQAWPLLWRVATARPYEPQIYQAMAHCLAELKRADLAMVFYEIAVGGSWNGRYRGILPIASMDYLHLLRRIAAGELKSEVPAYALAKREWLKTSAPAQRADLVVTMMWSTDRTDVDLHVLEPTGEECYYQHRRTRIGGQLTRDVRQGFGPEMYLIRRAKPGDYRVLANYYGEDANRTAARTKVYLTIYENFGEKDEKVTRRTVLLQKGGEKREVAKIKIDK